MWPRVWWGDASEEPLSERSVSFEDRRGVGASKGPHRGWARGLSYPFLSQMAKVELEGLFSEVLGPGLRRHPRPHLRGNRTRICFFRCSKRFSYRNGESLAPRTNRLPRRKRPHAENTGGGFRLGIPEAAQHLFEGLRPDLDDPGEGIVELPNGEQNAADDERQGRDHERVHHVAP